MRKIADSTVRRLSLYLRFLEEFERQGMETISSEELADRGGTTSEHQGACDGDALFLPAGK